VCRTNLLPVLRKMFTNFILNRIKRSLEFDQRKEQPGFRNGYSLVDYVQILNDVMEWR